jgi:hypothetical protein
MVHKERGEGKKLKPRGRPFVKGNKRGKLENGVLASSGRESGNEGGVVAPTPQSSNVEPAKQEIQALNKLPELVITGLEKQLKEAMETPIEPEKEIKEEAKPLELIESMDFKNGENVLSIRFSKKHNRMFRIQIFLNGENEIRPVTYTGASTGYSFWNLLKGALKK